MKQLNTILRWARWAVLAVCSIYLLFIFVGLITDLFLEPNRSSIELIKTLFELALWLSIPVFIGVILLRAWKLSIIALGAVILFGLIIVPQLIPRTPNIDPNARQLTVLTFNLKTTASGIEEVLRSANADIVALQELSQAGAETLAALSDIYPYQALHPQAVDYNGQGVLSRYTIVDDVYWEYADVPYTLGHQRIEIDFEGVILVLYNTHPWPPLGWETGYNDESHRVALQDIAKRTFAEELPLILVGDFNMSDSFAEYALLSSRFVDSYRAAGNSVGYTFPNEKLKPLPPLLRLDYIWHNAYFESVKSVVWGEYAGSDHSPVLSTLALANKEQLPN